MVEMPNVDVSREMIDLISASRLMKRILLWLKLPVAWLNKLYQSVIINSSWTLYHHYKTHRPTESKYKSSAINLSNGFRGENSASSVVRPPVCLMFLVFRLEFNLLILPPLLIGLPLLVLLICSRICQRSGSKEKGLQETQDLILGRSDNIHEAVVNRKRPKLRSTL